jgi:hypothetical protein
MKTFNDNNYSTIRCKNNECFKKNQDGSVPTEEVGRKLWNRDLAASVELPKNLDEFKGDG